MDLDREVVGLEDVKSQIRSLHAQVVVSRRRSQFGVSEHRDLHLVVTGAAGTGKCLVVVCCSADQMPESGATLRFASDVAAIATKAPTKHVAKNVLRARSANVTRPRRRSTK